MSGVKDWLKGVAEESDDPEYILEGLSTRNRELCREAMRKHMMHLDQVHYVSDTVVREKLAKLLEQ